MAKREAAVPERAQGADRGPGGPTAGPHHDQPVRGLELVSEASVGGDQPRQVLARLQRSHGEHEAGVGERLEFGRGGKRQRRGNSQRGNGDPLRGSGEAGEQRIRRGLRDADQTAGPPDRRRG